MQTVTKNDPAARLHAHDLLNDYERKINAACPLAFVHHEQDGDGATLVVHVPSGNVAEEAALAKLSTRLGRLTSSLPGEKADDPPAIGDATEEILESQKAVVSPLARARKLRRTAKPAEQASDESGPSGT